MKIKFLLLLGFLSLSGLAQKHHNVENIILISVDGFRWQEVFKGADSLLIEDKKFWTDNKVERRQKLLPFFWNEIAAKGQLYGNRDHGNKVDVKNKYWFSYPGRSETLCGYYDPKVNSNDYPNNPNENVLEFFNSHKAYKGKVITFASWNALGRILNRDRNGMLVNLPEEDVLGANSSEAQQLINELQHLIPDHYPDCRPDELTYIMTKAYIQKNKPKVIHIDFCDTDIYGHNGEYSKYLDAAHRIDKMIADLWNTLQNDPFYKDKTALLIFPDHGRGLGDKWTDHGTGAPHSNETWFAALGPGIPTLGEVSEENQIYQDQIAQTAAHILGMTFKANHPVGERIEGVYLSARK
ncbi:alkaline phosphatase family protein [Zhouia amylolytica]|uniref:alkaline phosphatase family protein n=1 Tax=Zhouia amylolytica TaxID=376730 RepID=UPI0020CCA132|nr:alkaline phosphatase family protein [Zhouia amylolytica]MCQ0112616.1 alkaline phosphatase family protein [Zhouia amylolytica]